MQWTFKTSIIPKQIQTNHLHWYGTPSVKIILHITRTGSIRATSSEKESLTMEYLRTTDNTYLSHFHSRPNYSQLRISTGTHIGRKSGRPAVCRTPRKSYSLAPDNIWPIRSPTAINICPNIPGWLLFLWRPSHTCEIRSNHGGSRSVALGLVSRNQFGTSSLSRCSRICHRSRADVAVINKVKSV